MKRAVELYNKDNESKYYRYYNYQPMLDNFGNILLQIDEKNYQGDSYVLYKDNDRYGILIFGWGSCSGCDSLQACESIEDVQDLMDSLYESIKWFDTKESVIDYFINHDWEGDFCGRNKECREFIEQSLIILHKS